MSPVLVGDRHFLYASAFTETVEDSILVSLLSRHDSANYDWDQSAPQLHSEEAVVLTHTGPNSENPIAFDQHLVFDADTDRLWMVWGGTQIYVSEMHPQNGRLIDDPRDPEYRTHPDSIYAMVDNFNGDEWTGKPEDGSEYFEGPALLKYGGYWYLFASYANLNTRYTIRMGRDDSPTGPFYDKQGRALLEFDSTDDEYGNSFFLGAR